MSHSRNSEIDSSNHQPGRKHQPRGLTILYEDRDIIVVSKIHGLLTMGCAREQQHTAYSLLTDYVKKGNSKSANRIFIVHRLDRETSGILIFAKTEDAKHFLQDNWHDFTKKYFAVVHGTLKQKEGVVDSYLYENKAFKVYSVQNPDHGKYARTGYRVLKESGKYSLLDIELFTGRKHQIRVHFSEMGHSVAGDLIYGIKEQGIRRLALHCYSLTINHPYTGKEMTFETSIPYYFNSLV